MLALIQLVYRKGLRTRYGTGEGEPTAEEIVPNHPYCSGSLITNQSGELSYLYPLSHDPHGASMFSR